MPSMYRDLPNGNRSTDAEVIAAADEEGRVVVSKDSDFVSVTCFAGSRVGSW